MRWMIVVVLVVALGIAAQMFRYKYVDQKVIGISYIVRIDRLTGRTCVISGPSGVYKTLQLQRC